jgi:hypothetical protein
MRRSKGSGLGTWLIMGAAIGVAAWVFRRRGRIFLAAVSGALTDRALRALADTFREDEDDRAEVRHAGGGASGRGSGN